MRTYLQNTIRPLIPYVVRSRLNSVKKYTRGFDQTGNAINNMLTLDELWIPSAKEVLDGYETNGVGYSSIYNGDGNRTKVQTGQTQAREWWLRTGRYAPRFSAVNNRGKETCYTSETSMCICLGFCLGLEPETITDSWETILANENPSSTYSIGDTKYLDLFILLC